VGPGGFEFGFEADDTLDVNAFKRLLVEEAISFRAEKALARRLRAERGGSAASGSVSGGAGATPDLVTHHHDDGMDGGAGAKGGAGALPAPATEVRR
jgi:hypothetical protein